MEEMVDAARRTRSALGPELDRSKPLVMGHEFVAEVVECGPGVEGWPPGTRVSGIPITGYNPDLPGAYSEYVLMGAAALLHVPEKLSNRIAAMTEPCAVGLHAVRAAKMQRPEHALVMGAGPIGLMTLLWLKREGVAHVTVTDLVEPRRSLARQLGADLVVDPASEDVVDAVTRAAGSPPPVVFECVGVEGTLETAIEAVAPGGRVVVVGVCMREDRIRPLVAISQQVTLHFVLAYTPDEFAEALQALGDGSVNPSPMLTRVVSLDELPAAFQALSDPKDCKVMLELVPEG